MEKQKCLVDALFTRIAVPVIDFKLSISYSCNITVIYFTSRVTLMSIKENHTGKFSTVMHSRTPAKVVHCMFQEVL